MFMNEASERQQMSQKRPNEVLFYLFPAIGTHTTRLTFPVFLHHREHEKNQYGSDS
jgi:hypothetical protein